MDFEERTANYFWNHSDLIGAGSTADVYRAYRISDGEIVAAKVFHPVSAHYFQGEQYESGLKELMTLQRLNHRNVIKFLGVDMLKSSIDNEIRRVLIMEYCYSGSLQSLLEKQQNFYGLEENEFLTLFHDLAEGLQYLRNQNVIHRDIKPSNIMLQLESDGTDGPRSVTEKKGFQVADKWWHTYKLADFGAAKELFYEYEEGFQSLVGTAEYLPPPMFEYWLTRDRTPLFKAEGELWTVGVTLYQAATGHIPFRPYLGVRKDQQTMLKIIKEKPKGSISGVQLELNGSIEYSCTLPNSCQLSKAFKSLLEPMLAKLLDSSRNNNYLFENYFNDAKNIMSLSQFHILNSTNFEFTEVFLPASSSVKRLYEELSAVYNIPQEDVALLSQNVPIDKVFEKTSPLKNLKKALGATSDNPLVLYSLGKISEISVSLPDIPTVEPIKRPNNVRDAFIWAKGVVGNMNYIARIVTKIESIPSILKSSILAISLYMHNEVYSLERQLQQYRLQVYEMQIMLTIIETIMNKIKNDTSTTDSLKEQQTVCSQISDILNQCDAGIAKMNEFTRGSNKLPEFAVFAFVKQNMWSDKIKCQTKFADELLVQFENETKIQHFTPEKTCAHMNRRERLKTLHERSVNILYEDFYPIAHLLHFSWQEWTCNSSTLFFDQHRQVSKKLRELPDLADGLPAIKLSCESLLSQIIESKCNHVNCNSFDLDDVPSNGLLSNIQAESRMMLPSQLLENIRELKKKQQDVDETLGRNEVALKKVILLLKNAEDISGTTMDAV